MGNLICEKVLRTRLGGVSHMWVRRKLKSDPSFPRFVRIGARQKFYDEDELKAWREARARLTAAQEAARAAP